MMTYTEALNALRDCQPLGMQMGLARMEHAMQALGYPERAFHAIHIAGTKGKGSTASMIAAALTANGHRVGLFTSPAVTSVRETIQIDGSAVSEAQFAAAVERVLTAVPTGLSEFECLTAAMLCCFEQNDVSVAVIECGLGGLDDATNVIPAPLCAVLTPIGIDHTAILGDTIEAIAQHKSGIIKTGCEVVCAASMKDDALAIIFETAAQKGCTVHQSTIRREDTLCVAGVEYRLAMRGQHQVENAQTAMSVLACLRHRGMAVDDHKAAAAIAKVQLPCRLEEFALTPPVLLDGAHNPQSALPLCEQLAMMDAPATLILGMLSDKDCEGVIRTLAPYCRRILCCTPPHTPRPAMKAQALAAIAAKYHTDVQSFDDPLQAYAYAKNAPDTTSIVVGGSFYTAAAIRQAITTE